MDEYEQEQTFQLCDYGKCRANATARLDIVDATGGDTEFYCEEHAQLQRAIAENDPTVCIHVDEPISELEELVA